MPGYHNLRLPEAYRALVSLTDRDFAWEWLRRSPDFRALWKAGGASTESAGAHAVSLIARSRRARVDIPQHPLARRWSRWGLMFRARA